MTHHVRRLIWGMEELNLASLPKYLSDESEAWLLLERLRWDGTPVCPHCGHLRRRRASRHPGCAIPLGLLFGFWRFRRRGTLDK